MKNEAERSRGKLFMVTKYSGWVGYHVNECIGKLIVWLLLRGKMKFTVTKKYDRVNIIMNYCDWFFKCTNCISL